jgi:hypothetical protein
MLWNPHDESDIPSHAPARPRGSGVRGGPCRHGRRNPVRKRLPPESDSAIQTLLDWQRRLDGDTEAHVIERLGEPDQRLEMPSNEASGEPMHTLKYRLSRHSALSIIVHQGEVAAVTITLVPSANESGPVEH